MTDRPWKVLPLSTAGLCHIPPKHDFPKSVVLSGFSGFCRLRREQRKHPFSPFSRRSDFLVHPSTFLQDFHPCQGRRLVPAGCCRAMGPFAAKRPAFARLPGHWAALRRMPGFQAGRRCFAAHSGTSSPLLAGFGISLHRNKKRAAGKVYSCLQRPQGAPPHRHGPFPARR